MTLLIGYIASFFLALSLIVSNAVKFRWLNLIGCLSFVIYGILIQATPVIIANSILLCINIYQTFKLYTLKEIFQLVEFSDSDLMLKHFLKFYSNDIQLYFPDFDLEKLNGNRIQFFVLRNLSIANIFVAEIQENGNASVIINYTIPKYRDYKVGKFIFEKEKDFLLAKGVNTLNYKTIFNNNHKKFLTKIGFKSASNGQSSNYSFTLN